MSISLKKFVNRNSEVLKLKHNIDDAYVVTPNKKVTMTERQKKLKVRRIARHSKMYNLKAAKKH